MNDHLREKLKSIRKRMESDDAHILNLLLLENKELRDALRGIKLGVTHIPPEHSYGDWTRKTLHTVGEMRRFAAEELERIGDMP